MLDRKIPKQRRKEEKKRWQVTGEREGQTLRDWRMLSKAYTGDDFSTALAGSHT